VARTDAAILWCVEDLAGPLPQPGQVSEACPWSSQGPWAIPRELLRDYVDQGFLGLKSGRGFYDDYGH